MATIEQQQARLDDAFNRIEETILPCIAMMLDTLLDASANLADTRSQGARRRTADARRRARGTDARGRAVQSQQPRARRLPRRLNDPRVGRGIDIAARHHDDEIGLQRHLPASTAASATAPPGSTVRLMLAPCPGDRRGRFRVADAQRARPRSRSTPKVIGETSGVWSASHNVGGASASTGTIAPPRSERPCRPSHRARRW